MAENFATLEAVVTPYIEKIMKETFNLEIEMLQGDRKLLPNGMIEYSIKIYDQQKAELFKEFMLKFISNSNNACNN